MSWIEFKTNFELLFELDRCWSNFELTFLMKLDCVTVLFIVSLISEQSEILLLVNYNLVIVKPFFKNPAL